MTPIQKIIKYFAIYLATALAIFLIVTIVSSILSGGYMLLSAFGLIKTDDTEITQEFKIISNQVNDNSKL